MHTSCYSSTSTTDVNLAAHWLVRKSMSGRRQAMRNHIAFLLVCVCLLCSGCHRRELEDVALERANIPISIDWTKCGIDPQNVSMLFYNKSDGALALQHYFENNSNPIQSYVKIAPDEYDVVVFNELANQIKNVTIQSMNNFSTIEAKGVKDTDVYLPIEGQNYVKEPGTLAAVMVRDFKVTYDMINISNSSEEVLKHNNLMSQLMGLVPHTKTTTFSIMVHIKGLNNALMPALVNLSNLSESYLFDEDRNGTLPAAYQFTINNRTYDSGSTSHGTISGETNIFGVLGQRSSTAKQVNNNPVILTLMFMLADENRTVITEVFDITDDIIFSDHGNGNIYIELNISVETPLPEVGPGGGDSGFGTNVANWNEVDIPIVAE